MRHKNIPIFIPHLGCPNMCVFCNQRTISGKEKFDITSVYQIIDTALKTVDPIEDEVEIAFFGGSFTGIDRNDMLYLLSCAKSYIEKGLVKSVRLSTRPDYISPQILDILKEYGVSDIELGVQSMDERVLLCSKRGHSSIDTKNACRLIKSYGFNLVGQMMLGLPSSSLEAEINTARLLIDCAVDAVRIYPTVVFAGTELEVMMKRGSYTPITIDEAANRAAAILYLLDEHKVPCIRCGLQSQDNLCDGDNVLGGGYHPSFGSIAMGRFMRMKIEKQLAALGFLPFNFDQDKTRYRKACPVTVYTSQKNLSHVMGYKKENKEYFYHKYNVKISVAEHPHIDGCNCQVKI